jgi:hypothetical protein
MIPYRAPGRVRQIAYLGILSVAAAGASVAAWGMGPWGAAPGCLVGYLAAYILHEHVLWRTWRRWHGVPDLSGRWHNQDDHLSIRQTWTRLDISGNINGRPITLRLAGWRDDQAILQVIWTTADHPLLAAELCLVNDRALELSSPTHAFPLSRWVH